MLTIPRGQTAPLSLPPASSGPAPAAAPPAAAPPAPVTAPAQESTQESSNQVCEHSAHSAEANLCSFPELKSGDKKKQPTSTPSGFKITPTMQIAGGQPTGSGDQIKYPPTGKGNGDGKTVYFFSGYTATEKDQDMRAKEDPHLVDDIQKLRANGYTVIVDPSGSKAEMKTAVENQNTAGIYWTGHGYSDGDVQTSDGGFMSPSDFDAAKASKNLRFCVFQSCNTGVTESDWEKALGTDVRAWNRTTSTSEANDFATPDSEVYEAVFGDTEELDDLIDDRLIHKAWD